MGTGVLIVGSKWPPLGSFKPPFPLGGNEGRGWTSQGEGLGISSSRGSCPGSRGHACPSTASLCGPDVAQALPAQAASLSAPTKAPPAVGRDPKRIMQTHSWGKLVLGLWSSKGGVHEEPRGGPGAHAGSEVAWGGGGAVASPGCDIRAPLPSQ